MTSFQKMASGLFLAARAGRGGGLLLLPFLLVFIGIFWVMGTLGSLLVAAISDLVAKAGQSNASERGR